MPDVKVVLTADVIIEFDDQSIVLAMRGSEPYKGSWALPGGKMEENERIEETAVREAEEETGLRVELQKIIGVYSRPGRDPRGRYISVAFLAHPVGGNLKAGSDAMQVIKTKKFEDFELAFDHTEILMDYLKFK